MMWIGGVGMGVVVMVVLAEARGGVAGTLVVGLVQVMVVIPLGVVHVGVLGRLGGGQVSGRWQVGPLRQGAAGEGEPAREQAYPQDPYPCPHLPERSIGMPVAVGRPATRRSVVG